jgi:hypothetical protein
MEADPIAETLCLEKTKMMDNVQKNSHVYCNRPLSETFRFTLVHLSLAQVLKSTVVAGCERLCFTATQNNIFYDPHVYLLVFYPTCLILAHFHRVH